MSKDDDILMSCADGGHVLELESKVERKLRKNREKARKYRKKNPSRPRSALTGEELERIRTQGRDSQRRYSRKKKKQNAVAENEAQLHEMTDSMSEWNRNDTFQIWRYASNLVYWIT